MVIERDAQGKAATPESNRNSEHDAKKQGYIIQETADYEGLIPFFIENGLEFSVDDEVPTDIAKCWRAECVEERNAGKLIGGCVLALREGEFICDGIAAAPGYRSAGLGGQLLEVLVDEVKRRGGTQLYLVARAPGFFAKKDFIPVSRDSAPTFFECFGCPQYQKTCFPEVMRLTIEKG
jgi:N-acetylglutamate synthase-like GNAT family acetyltransferase